MKIIETFTVINQKILVAFMKIRKRYNQRFKLTVKAEVLYGWRLVGVRFN